MTQSVPKTSPFWHSVNSILAGEEPLDQKIDLVFQIALASLGSIPKEERRLSDEEFEGLVKKHQDRTISVHESVKLSLANQIRQMEKTEERKGILKGIAISAAAI